MIAFDVPEDVPKAVVRGVSEFLFGEKVWPKSVNDYSMDVSIIDQNGYRLADGELIWESGVGWLVRDEETRVETWVPKTKGNKLFYVHNRELM